jgi:hypothetical protein
VVVAAAFGCGGAEERSNPSAGAPSGSAPAGAPTLPAQLVLAAEPAGARPIAEIIATLTAPAAVVARGRVGEEGKQSWFTLADAAIKPCTETGDECPTPWDYCCTSNEDKAKNMATVELHAGGKLLEQSPLGFAGLDHLKEVVVTGQATKDDGGNVTIVASGIWVKE